MDHPPTLPDVHQGISHPAWKEYLSKSLTPPAQSLLGKHHEINGAWNPVFVKPQGLAPEGLEALFGSLLDPVLH